MQVFFNNCPHPLTFLIDLVPVSENYLSYLIQFGTFPFTLRRKKGKSEHESRSHEFQWLMVFYFPFLALVLHTHTHTHCKYMHVQISQEKTDEPNCTTGYLMSSSLSTIQYGHCINRIFILCFIYCVDSFYRYFYNNSLHLHAHKCRLDYRCILNIWFQREKSNVIQLHCISF